MRADDVAVGRKDSHSSPTFKQLWNWWQLVRNQDSTTVGDEESTTVWRTLKSAKKTQIQNSRELADLLLALFLQYSDQGFVGRSKRKQAGTKCLR